MAVLGALHTIIYLYLSCFGVKKITMYGAFFTIKPSKSSMSFSTTLQYSTIFKHVCSPKIVTVLPTWLYPSASCSCTTVRSGWLFDDPRLDQSIAEPLQSVNHLAFSPQKLVGTNDGQRGGGSYKNNVQSKTMKIWSLEYTYSIIKS